MTFLRSAPFTCAEPFPLYQSSCRLDGLAAISGTPASPYVDMVAPLRRRTAKAMGGEHAVRGVTSVLRVVRPEPRAARPRCTPGVGAATAPDSWAAAVFHVAVQRWPRRLVLCV